MGMIIARHASICTEMYIKQGNHFRFGADEIKEPRVRRGSFSEEEERRKLPSYSSDALMTLFLTLGSGRYLAGGCSIEETDQQLGLLAQRAVSGDKSREPTIHFSCTINTFNDLLLQTLTVLSVPTRKAWCSVRAHPAEQKKTLRKLAGPTKPMLGSAQSNELSAARSGAPHTPPGSLGRDQDDG